MQKLRPKSPDGANSPSFYSSPPITTFNHTQISLLPVPKFQPASGKPRPRAGVLKSLQTSAQKRVRSHVATATLTSPNAKCRRLRNIKPEFVWEISSPSISTTTTTILVKQTLQT